MSKATALNEVVTYFNPMKALKDDDLDHFYVERESPAAIFEQHILLEDAPKFLFSGHMGSGKSTELQKILRALRERKECLPVYFDAVEVLDPNDLEYTDVLFAMAAAIYNSASDKGITFDARLENELKKFTLDVTREIEEINAIGIGAFLKAFFFEAGGRYSKEDVVRTKVRENIQPRTTRLITLINSLIREIRDRDIAPVVIIDSLDHTPLGEAEKVFLHYGRLLTEVSCAVIYTVPIEFLYIPRYSHIKDYFNDSKSLPNLRPEKDYAILEEVVHKRMDKGLFEPDVLKHAIMMSGGIVRSLIRLINLSSVRAIVAGKEKIDMDSLNAEVKEVRNDFLRYITKQEHIDALLKVYQNNSIELIDTKTREELMEGRCIVEYSDGAWWGTHPIVVEILRKRGHLR